jgi:hypothetical protein
MQVKQFHEDIDLMSPVANKSDGSLESDSSPMASPRNKLGGGLMVSFGKNLTVQTKNLKMMKEGDGSKSPSPRLKKLSS